MESITTTLPATVKAEDIQALATNAPAALSRNQITLQRVTEAGQALLAEYKANGFSDELDQKMNTYLVKCQTAKKECNDRRSELTKFLSEITSAFTAIENGIDKAKAGTIPAQVQQIRNDFAKFVAEKNAEAERQRLAALAKSQEAISIKSDIQQSARAHFDRALTLGIDLITTLFNDMTLDSFEEKSKEIQNFRDTLFDFTPDMKSTMTVRYHSEEEVKAIVTEALTGYYQTFAAEYKTVINEKKQSLIEKFSGKRVALEEEEQARLAALEAKRKADELAAAAKSEADKKKAQEANEAAEKARIENERLAKEKADREEADRLKENQAAEQRAKDAAAKAELEKAAAEANAAFDNAINAEPTIESAAQVRTGYNIIVKAPAGYMLIFQQWWNIEGSKLAIDKFDKKSLGQMKSACEKHAHKTGEKIDSPFIKYENDYNVAAKK